MLVSGRTSVFVCSFPFCSDVPIRMKDLRGKSGGWSRCNFRFGRVIVLVCSLIRRVIKCEALDIQTHMMRSGMNEPPFTSPEPKLTGFQRVPNSHLQTPGMTGGWLGCQGFSQAAQTRKSRNLNRTSKGILWDMMQTRNEPHDRQKTMNINGEIVWNKNNYKNSGKDDPIPWLLTPTPSDPPGVSHMFCFPFSFRWNNINGPLMSRCPEGWLADPAQQDKPGKSEASCCTQESEGDRKIDVENRVVDLATKFGFSGFLGGGEKGGVPFKIPCICGEKWPSTYLGGGGFASFEYFVFSCSSRIPGVRWSILTFAYVSNGLGKNH